MTAIAEKYLTVPMEDKGLGGDTGSTKGQIIGLYGGSFNPPHEGHILVAETALRRLRLNALWWLVSPGNPLKDKRASASLSMRIAACETLINNPHIAVTAFEERLAVGGTAAMLDIIVPKNPQTRFIWIMGADNLAEFHLWRDWRHIMQTVPIAVIDRPGFSRADKTSPAALAFASGRIAAAKAGDLTDHMPPAWVFLRGRRSSLSSTQIRQRQAEK